MNDLVFKRKFRWTVSGGSGDNILFGEVFARVLERPKLTLEQVPLPDGGYTVAEGKWSHFSFTVYDYDLEDKSMFENICENKCEWLEVKLYDGNGNPLEEWKLDGVKFKKFDFFDLDCSSSSVCDVEFTFEFKSAKYTSLHQIKP